VQENDTQFPNKKITVHNVLGDGDLVAVHSHLVLKPGETEMIVVHLFRFQNEKIVELWDCGQAIPSDCPNEDGPF
jgi:predicted SnoaL-like aldol condensation-catalyzing enzyme